jgi:GTPase SAR1 family protein
LVTSHISITRRHKSSIFLFSNAETSKYINPFVDAHVYACCSFTALGLSIFSPKAIILCYDVSDRSSFESMDKWMNEATRFGDTKMIALGLKIDKPRAVHEQQAKTWASTKGLMYLEVSAFENKKIDDLWRRVIDI